MIKWEDLAKPKDHGGLIFTDTRLMNGCLLAKWIIKLERGDEDMRSTLLRKKYLKGREFFSSNPRGGSQFWKGLHEVKPTCQRGMKYIIGNGNKARLWHEVWLGDCPLIIRFSKLYSICDQQAWEVSGLERG
jgi:hypothetical protein